MKLKQYLGLSFLFYLLSFNGIAQPNDTEGTGQEILLENAQIQLESTYAINDMYNFKFDRASQQFVWLKQKYKEHPIGYFLLALNEWWKMMPNTLIEDYDEDCFAYLDSCIVRAKKMYQSNKTNIEGSFFLSAAYGLKSRLHSERKNWTASILAGKACLKYLKRGKKLEELSPELLFGEGLYNYYSVWIPDNYPLLIPVLAFFEKGDREEGIKQLKEVSRNAFYTRTEAQYFLMRIYRDEAGQQSSIIKKYRKKDKEKYAEAVKKRKEYLAQAMLISQNLYKTYPENAYFQRYYTSLCFTQGKFKIMYENSQDILKKLEAKQTGYESVSGRYAAYYVAYYSEKFLKNQKQAKKHYEQTVKFAEELKFFKSLYYLESLWYLAKVAHKNQNYKKAKMYYTKIKKYARKKKKKYYKEAKKYLKKYKKI